MKNGISDIIKGLSEGEVKGQWGHPEDYYTDFTICSEAFAHFFEAGMSYKPLKMMYVMSVFPNAYNVFEDMLKENLK